MDFRNIPNIPKRNQALVSGAFVMGIISVIVAFTCLNFLAPVLGGLGILFALLSKGKEDTLEKKAKCGLILSTVSIIATVILTVVTFVLTYIKLSQYEPDELHDYLNEVYEDAYGQSFDELYEDLYGEDFDEVFDEMFKN